MSKSTKSAYEVWYIFYEKTSHFLSLGFKVEIIEGCWLEWGVKNWSDRQFMIELDYLFSLPSKKENIPLSNACYIVCIWWRVNK